MVLQTILPGHRYARHLVSAGDEVCGGDRPWTMIECVACLERRKYGAATLEAGACGTFCHGDTPCARPFRHDGEHSCRRDAFDIP